MIVGVKTDGTRYYLGARLDALIPPCDVWTTNREKAYIYTDHDTALQDFFAIDKRTFARVFVPCAD